MQQGALFALLSALLFGVSAPLAKELLGSIDPWLLAGLLYLGSGLGLSVAVAVRRLIGGARKAEAPLVGHDWLWLGGAIGFGGVLGPVLLMLGLALTPAATASLLLNLEGVLTALLAWFWFHENFDRRIFIGMMAIVGGAAILSWPDSVSLSGIEGPLLVAAGCFAWAIDNNLTRKVSLSDPLQIAALKGLVAGITNVVLALAFGISLPSLPSIAAAALLGLFAYGISLVLFVRALREIGTARTSAYYSIAPFAGALVALPLLGEAMTPQLIAAGALMALGVWLHLSETHNHEHRHDVLAHEHRHTHDVHHAHHHGATAPAGEPHSHAHVHEAQIHAHAHYPDAHHRHRH